MMLIAVRRRAHRYRFAGMKRHRKAWWDPDSTQTQTDARLKARSQSPAERIKTGTPVAMRLILMRRASIYGLTTLALDMLTDNRIAAADGGRLRRRGELYQ